MDWSTSFAIDLENMTLAPDNSLPTSVYSNESGRSRTVYTDSSKTQRGLLCAPYLSAPAVLAEAISSG